MAFLYLDSAEPIGRLAVASVARRLCLEAGPTLTVEALCAALQLPARTPDARIARLVRRMDATPDAFPDAASAASAAGLSASRFHALFRAGLGLPFRRYRLWRRLRTAVTYLVQGAPLTAAALDAGFASAAHFSATFKTMFGLTPSALAALRPTVANTPPLAVPRRP